MLRNCDGLQERRNKSLTMSQHYRHKNATSSQPRVESLLRYCDGHQAAVVLSVRWIVVTGDQVPVMFGAARVGRPVLSVAAHSWRNG